MNDPEIEAIILRAEKQAGNHLFVVARRVGIFAGVLTLAVFFSALAPLLTLFAFVGWITAASLWADARESQRELMKSRARVLWKQIDRLGVLGETPSFKERQMLNDIGRIYDRDPQGQILPLPQAIRLARAWKQQQKHLHLVSAHIEHMRVVRGALQENKKRLRELNDEDVDLEQALVHLSDDLSPLEGHRNELRASCARLESLLLELDASARRRELHQNVGELTARLPLPHSAESLELFSTHLDLERQIGREIETYLQLERETEVHLRSL